MMWRLFPLLAVAARATAPLWVASLKKERSQALSCAASSWTGRDASAAWRVDRASIARAQRCADDLFGDGSGWSRRRTTTTDRLGDAGRYGRAAPSFAASVTRGARRLFYKKAFDTRLESPCFDYGMREGNATTCEWEWRAPRNASCALREFDAASARALLRGRHLMLVGDSVTRILWGNLANLLAGGDHVDCMVPFGREYGVSRNCGEPERTRQKLRYCHRNVVFERTTRSSFDFLPNLERWLEYLPSLSLMDRDEDTAPLVVSRNEEKRAKRVRDNACVPVDALVLQAGMWDLKTGLATFEQRLRRLHAALDEEMLGQNVSAARIPVVWLGYAYNPKLFETVNGRAAAHPSSADLEKRLLLIERYARASDQIFIPVRHMIADFDDLGYTFEEAPNVVNRGVHLPGAPSDQILRVLLTVLSKLREGAERQRAAVPKAACSIGRPPQGSGHWHYAGPSGSS